MRGENAGLTRQTPLRQRIESMKIQLQEMYGLENRAELLLNGVASELGCNNCEPLLIDDDQATPRPHRSQVYPESTPERLRHYASQLQQICKEQPENQESEAMYLASPRDPFVASPKYHLPENGGLMEASRRALVPAPEIVRAQQLIDQLSSEDEGQLGVFKKTRGPNTAQADLLEAQLQTRISNDQLRRSAEADEVPGGSQKTATASRRARLCGLDASAPPAREAPGSASIAQKSLHPNALLSERPESAVCDTLLPEPPPGRLSYEMKQRIRAAQKSPRAAKNSQRSRSAREVPRYGQPSEYRLSRIFSGSRMGLAANQYGQFKEGDEYALKKTLRQPISNKAQGALVHARALSRQNDRKYGLNLTEWQHNLKDWRREQQNDMLLYRKCK